MSDRLYSPRMERVAEGTRISKIRQDFHIYAFGRGSEKAQCVFVPGMCLCATVIIRGLAINVEIGFSVVFAGPKIVSFKLVATVKV